MACDAKRTVEMMAFRKILRLMKIMRYLPSGFLTPGIQLPCQMMIGVYNHRRNARYLGSITILRR